MTVLIESHGLKTLSESLVTELTSSKLSYASAGWMQGAVRSVRRGWMRKYTWNSTDESMEWEYQQLNYSRAHALLAKNEAGEILGWALIRHPERIVRRSRSVPLWGSVQYLVKTMSAGRRSDFMVYVTPKGRRKGIARKLLVVAYNNFGKLDVYPHDCASESFYRKNRRFVVPHHTDNFLSEDYRIREVE